MGNFVAEFPDAEAACIMGLRAHLQGVPVRQQADKLGTRQCVVKLTSSGTRLDPRRVRVQLTVTCWGKDNTDSTEAFNLAAKCLNWVEERPYYGHMGKYPCHKVDIVSYPYYDPDSSQSVGGSGIARYSFTFRTILAGVI